MGLIFKKCDISDLNVLRDISEETFYETFREICDEKGMATYLKEAFSREQMTGELENPDSEFFLLLDDDQVVGYMKLNEASAQQKNDGDNSIELQRIYIPGRYQGRGYGTYLMDRAIEIAVQKQKEYMWLGVWHKNYEAISLYKKYGFYKTGEYKFDVGSDLHSNITMRKDL